MNWIEKFKEKLYVWKINTFEYQDPLMCIPFHRKKISEWEKQNIKDDIKRLKQNKKNQRTKVKLREKQKARRKRNTGK